MCLAYHAGHEIPLCLDLCLRSLLHLKDGSLKRPLYLHHSCNELFPRSSPKVLKRRKTIYSEKGQ